MRVDSSGTNRSEVWAEAGRSSSLPRSEHMTLQTVMKKEGNEEFQTHGQEILPGQHLSGLEGKAEGEGFPFLWEQRILLKTE